MAHRREGLDVVMLIDSYRSMIVRFASPATYNYNYNYKYNYNNLFEHHTIYRTIFIKRKDTDVGYSLPRNN